jgi:tubulin epsilon
MSSLGGGTGSGLGSKVGELLMDAYPEVWRFGSVVLPSFASSAGGNGGADDVVTSPYNS